MKDDAIASGGSVLSWILTITQTNEIFALIQIIASTIVSILTILYILWKWYKKAKEDGKITADEVENLAEELKNANKKEDDENVSQFKR